MIEFISKKISGLRKRIQCFRYGILYLKISDYFIPSTFWINWIPKKFVFIDTKNSSFIYEFNEICLNDCYHLKALKKKMLGVHVIVDIGANQGLFVMAARQNFAKAAIHAYEPNEQLKPILTNNLQALNAIPFFEAATQKDCMVKLNFGATDLHTTTSYSEFGQITGTSFKKIIERAGGKIDILKMDCEGGEWELFDDTEVWKEVNAITMEYHLWAKPGTTIDDLFKTLKALNFEIIHHNVLSESFGLLVAIKRN